MIHVQCHVVTINLFIAMIFVFASGFVVGWGVHRHFHANA